MRESDEEFVYREPFLRMEDVVGITAHGNNQKQNVVPKYQLTYTY